MFTPRGVCLVALRYLAALRILLFPLKLRQLRTLRFMRGYLAKAVPRDTFFFLTHDYYLSRGLTLAQRTDCAINHYRFEQDNYGSRYRSAVYGSPGGLVLWEHAAKDVRSTIVLRATEDYRYEGDLSVLCLVNHVRVCRVSFSYVQGAPWGLDPVPTMFVTRNQTDRNAELRAFRDTFKQNSPPYFCLAAVSGIAMANGMHGILLIRDDAQIAYSANLATGFRNSYSAMWQALGAGEIENRSAFLLPIPLRPTPIADVTHRNRAAARRRHWQEVALSARLVMLQNRTSAIPPPIEPDVEKVPRSPVPDSRLAGRQACDNGR